MCVCLFICLSVRLHIKNHTAARQRLNRLRFLWHYPTGNLTIRPAGDRPVTGLVTGEIYQFLTGPWPAGWPAKFTIFKSVIASTLLYVSRYMCIWIQAMFLCSLMQSFCRLSIFILFYYIILTDSDRPVTYLSTNANTTRPVTQPNSTGWPDRFPSLQHSIIRFSVLAKEFCVSAGSISASLWEA